MSHPFGPILLLVNTKSFGDNDHCKVRTSYLLAAKRPFSWLFPILKKLIERNNSILMSEDTPMRDRRGELRRSGHHFFKPAETYGFEFTTQIDRNNVRKGIANPHVTISLADIHNPEIHEVGDPIGILNFQLTRANGDVSVWPTTCPHEGAHLKVDAICIKKGSVECPWHGRKIAPICVITGDKLKKLPRKSPYKLSVQTDLIHIEYLQN